MSKFKFTDGPWAYDRNHSVIYGMGIRYCSEDEIPRGFSGNSYSIVCKLENHFNYKTRTYLDERTDADARLISCAPEMLDALIDAYTGIIDEPSQLKNIIEKATGMTIDEVLK